MTNWDSESWLQWFTVELKKKMAVIVANLGDTKVGNKFWQNRMFQNIKTQFYNELNSGRKMWR